MCVGIASCCVIYCAKFCGQLPANKSIFLIRIILDFSLVAIVIILTITIIIQYCIPHV